MDEPAALPWQQAAWARVTASRRAGRLPHAMLLVGPPGVGKRQFARRLARALECEAVTAEGEACGHCRPCRLTFVGNHPDVNWVCPEQDEKTIKIDAVRRLTEQSILAPEGSGYRVFVLEPADSLSHGAANALLKTLEEPTPRTLLVLISSRPSRLPATLRSRCQRVALPAPDREMAAAWLSTQRQGERAEAALGLAGGAPLMALEFAHQGVVEQVSQRANDLRGIINGDVEPIALAAQWQKTPLEATLGYLQQWTIDLIRLKNNENPPLTFHAGLEHVLEGVAEAVDLRGLFGLLGQITEFRRLREHNLNPLLLIENILIICSRLKFAE